MKSLVLHCLLAFLLVLGVGGNALARDAVFLPNAGAQASLSRTDWHSDVASLHHQSVCEGMVAPTPSLQPQLLQAVCFLLEGYFCPPAPVLISACLPPVAQRYYRNLFRLLRVINAP